MCIPAHTSTYVCMNEHLPVPLGLPFQQLDSRTKVSLQISCKIYIIGQNSSKLVIFAFRWQMPDARFFFFRPTIILYSRLCSKSDPQIKVLPSTETHKLPLSRQAPMPECVGALTAWVGTTGVWIDSEKYCSSKFLQSPGHPFLSLSPQQHKVATKCPLNGALTFTVGKCIWMPESEKG